MPIYPTYKLGEVAEILDSFRKPINSTERAKRIQGKSENELYPYYGATGQVGLIDKYLIDGEYVLVGEDGAPFLEPFKNKSYIIKGKAWVNNHAHIILGKKGVSCNQYLNYYLNSFDYKDYVNGTTRLKLTQGNLVEIPIPLPPLPTQHQIVSRIESLFAELDKAEEHLRTAQQQLKIYRQAVLNHWLNNEDGKWEMVPIKEIISVISNGSTPKADKMFSKGEIQFLKVYNLNFDGSINLSKEPVFIERDTHETLLKRSQTKQGDVLINIVGPPLGKVSIIPEGEKEYNINQAIVMFRPNEFVTSKFLAYYLMSPQVIAWLTSTSKATAGQYNVKVSTCREIMFPKISISDQQRIVKEIESRLSQAEAAEARIAEALQKTEALQQSILKKAFSGEFDL